MEKSSLNTLSQMYNMKDEQKATLYELHFCVKVKKINHFLICLKDSFVFGRSVHSRSYLACSALLKSLPVETAQRPLVAGLTHFPLGSKL